MTEIKDFCRAFYRAMGDRDVHLRAYRDAAITIAVIGALLAVVQLAHASNT